MIKKKNKLNTREHLEVVKNGKRYHNSVFTIQYLSVLDSHTKCAVVIPKKIYKKAHERNKIRRKIFEIVDNIYPQLPKSTFIIVLLRSVIKDDNYNPIKKEFSLFLEKCSVNK